MKSLLRTKFGLSAASLLFLLSLRGVPLMGQTAANVLIVAGADGLAQHAASVINTELTNAGDTVTVVNTGVPVSLAGFTQIYDVRYSNAPAFSNTEMNQYVAFLGAAPGNTIFLMGENAGFAARNTLISDFIALAGGGAIARPTASSVNSETVNPPFTGPNTIANVTFAACGLVTSAGNGAFASQESGGGCSLYFSPGTLTNASQGALVVVYDVNFIATAPTGGLGVNEIPFRLNLENYAANPPAPPAVTSVAPSNGSVAGGTSITLTGAGFTGATSVTVGGASATNVVVVNDTTITATTPAGAAGAASVQVTAPNGISSANTLFTYGVATPAFQMISLLPANLQAVQSQMLIVSGIAAISANQGANWQASTTTAWLTINNTSGAFPGVIGLTADATGMAPGTYSGSITVASSGQTMNVPVILTVLPAESVTADVPMVALASGYPAVGATGFDIHIAPAGVPFTVQTSATSGGWLSVSPASGVGPATIHVVLDPTNATPGIYQDNILIASTGVTGAPLVIPATMAVSGFVPTLPQQVNAATGAGPDHTVAANEIVSLSLSDFSCSSQPVVSINGTPVAWSSWNAPGPILYAVPASVTQPAVLSVACNGVTAWTFNGLNVASTIPGIMTADGSGTGQAAANSANGSANSMSNPASAGSYVSVFVTGFGSFDPATAGGLKPLSATVTAQVGGVPAAVEYAGDTPNTTDGLQQINVLVPSGVPTGCSLPVMFWVNGVATQSTATIAIQ